MKTSKVIMPLLALCIGFASCSKDDEKNTEAETKADMQDIAVAMNGSMELDAMGEMSLEGDPQQKTEGVLACATFAVDTTGPTTLITLDFGTSNCQGVDGKYRRGIIQVEFEDNPYDAGSVYTLTADGYAVNDFEYNGSRTVTYVGLDNNSNPHSTIASTLSITKPNNGMITWSSNRTRTWIAGFANFNPFDNEFAIVGNATVNTQNNTNVSLEIMDDLIVKSNCSNIVAGELRISSSAFNTRLLNYGNGDCDNEAIISVNGSSRTIKL